MWSGDKPSSQVFSADKRTQVSILAHACVLGQWPDAHHSGLMETDQLFAGLISFTSWAHGNTYQALLPLGPQVKILANGLKEKQYMSFLGLAPEDFL